MKEEPYAWISEQKLPQSIVFQWKEEQEISQIRVTVEMPLADHRCGYKPAPSPDKMITELSVELLVNDEWTLVKCVEDNFYRQIVMDIEPQKALALRLTIIKAYNYDKAVIPEIRIY